jgi:hypothetical protein
MARELAALLVALALLGGARATGTAQEPTPSAGAAECTVEPYDLSAIFDRPERTPSAATDGTLVDPLTGKPADEETTRRVTETVELLIGCVNLGYQFKWLYLFTPEYLAVLLAEQLGSVTAADVQFLNEAAPAEVSPGPLPEEQQTLILAIEEVQRLDDGRVIATVVSDDLSSDDGPSPRQFLFREVDGRFLIDGVLEPTAAGTPEP